MKWRFLRLRTLLVVIALIAVGMGYAVTTWRRAGFAFQREYATKAFILRDEFLRERVQANNAERHVGAGHPCSKCRDWPVPPRASLRRARERIEKLQHEIYWVRLFAGPGINPDAWNLYL